MLLTLFITSGGILAGTALYQKRTRPHQELLWLNKLRTIKQNAATLLWNDTRQQQLLAHSSEHDIQARQQTEHQINRTVWVSVLSTGFAAAGYLLYPPLGLLSLPGIAYVSLDILHSAYRTLVAQRRANVDLLTIICKAFLLAGGHLFWCSFSGVIFALNKKTLQTIQSHSQNNLIDVFRQQPRTAWLVHNEVDMEVPVNTLTADSIVQVGAGEVIPVDGTVVSGIAAVDQHILTGESQPVEKVQGNPVFASTLVLSGQIQIQVGTVGKQTMAAQIGQLLNDTAKTDQQLQVEHFSDKTIIPTLLGGLISVPIIGPAGALVVIQSHFEHRMTIVSSIGLHNYLNLASQQDLLIKNGSVFEQLQQVDTVVFDKTGTLTEEVPEVGQVHLCADYNADTVLQYAAAAEGKQNHPIAQAIRNAAKTRGLDIPTIEQADYQIGYGVTVTLDQHSIQLGSLRFMQTLGIHLPETIQTANADSAAQGHSMVLLAVDEQIVAGIEIQPTIRPEAKAIITGLRKRGIKKTYIISGDQAAPTQTLANKLDIDDYFADVLPEQKAELIAQLQDAGQTICFIGDGINDCIAMKQADVSISLGDASTVAVDTAQVILLNNGLNRLNDLFDIATQYRSSMKLTYTLVGLPSAISVGGAFFWNFGLLQAMLIPQMGLVIGALYTLYPLLTHNHKKTMPTN